MKKSKDIIRFARELKHTLGTNDPFAIAEHFKIPVLLVNSCLKDFTAQTVKGDKYPTFISINNVYDDFSKKVLCAHELGHALLHSSGVNTFAFTRQNIHTDVENEANLFAIALLGSDDIEETLASPLESLPGYTLKAILDYNLHKQ